MIKKRYCIICGKEIQSDYPDEVFCPEHGGASKIDATTTRPQETTWEAEEEVVQPIKDIAASWQPGQTLLDTYKVVGKLGEGGMGLVYLVHHKSWNMDLAVKQPKATLFATQKGKEDFIREAETWVDLGLHPHITSCYYVRVIDDIPHIFVEFMEGKSLEHWIQRKDYDLYAGGPEESLERILDIAIQFAWGLAYAHEQGLVHQDVKPLNVLMTPEGIMKVTDFGLAKARAKAGETVGGKDTRALVNGSLHTVEYRSPEQAKGEMLSHKTDIWSWGVSVLEMFEGGVFWLDGQSAGISLESYLGHEGENHLPSMPDGLIELLQACFQKDPVRRPENILIIAKGLIETYERNIGKPYQRQRPEPAELKADSLNNKALTMLDLGHEDIAIQNWTEALEEDPAHGEANLNYQAYLWWKAEITDDKMLANLTQISGTNMASPTFWKGMAELHGERGDWKEQGECLKKAIQLCPTLPIPEEKNLILQKSVLKGHSQQVFSLQLNPGQDILASAGSDGSIRLWDIKVGRCLKILKNAGFTTSLAFSPDGGELVSGSSDKTVKVWNLSKGRLVKQLKGHTDVVTSVAFSNDGQYIISGSLDGTARVWKRSNGRCIQEYKEHQHWILSIQIPAEGDLALTASRDQTVHLWQIQTGETVRVYERPRSPRKAEYGRGCLNAGKILWAGYDSMCLWDYGSGRLITQFISCQEKGAIDPYMSGDLSPVGTYAVTVGQNGEKRFWETSSGRCISTIPSPNSAGSVIFGPDDKLFCAVGKDIEVWQVKLDPDRHFYHYALSIPANSIIALEKQSQLKDHLEQAKGYQDQRQPEKAIQILRSLQNEPEFKHDEKILNQLADCAMLGQKAGLRECWMHSSYHLDKPEGIGGVTAVRFNSTATMLAAGHRDGSVHCFDLNTRKKERELQRHIGKVEAFVFLSPESLLSLSRNGDLILWNIPQGDGKVVKTRLDPSTGAFLTVLLAEDGQYLVVQGLKGYSRIPIHLERLEMLPERPFKPLVIRANLDLRMPAMMKDTLTGFVYQSAVSPDGTLFTSTLGDSRYGRSAHPVFVWEITPGGIKSFRRFIGHTHPVLTMTFSKDQTELITADIGGEIRIWDLPGDACKRTFKQPASQFTAIDCSPDGNFIIAGDSKGKLFLWDHDGKALLNIKPHRGKINSVTFSDNGRFAASGGFDNQIQVWEFDWDYQFPRPTDWNEGARPYAEIFLTRHQPLDPITKIPRGRPVWKSKDLEQLIRALSFAGFGWLREDGVHRKLEELAGGNHTEAQNKPKQFKGVSKGKSTIFQEHVLQEHYGKVYNLAVTPDGRYAVSGGEDMYLHKWDLERGEFLDIFAGQHSSVTALGITPDGHQVISSSSELMFVWDLESGSLLHTLESQTNSVYAIDITPDGHRLVAGGVNGKLEIWDLKSGILLRALEGHKSSVYSLAVTPDGRKIVSCSGDNSLRVWDIESGGCLHTLEGHEQTIYALAITPNGQHVVSGGYDEALRVWDLESGACLRTLKGFADDIVNTLAITPDGRWVISGGSENKLRVWDFFTGEYLHTVEGHTNEISKVIITPDGRRVVSGSFDTTLRVWALECE